eukprot:UN26324
MVALIYSGAVLIIGKSKLIFIPV